MHQQESQDFKAIRDFAPQSRTENKTLTPSQFGNPLSREFTEFIPKSNPKPTMSFTEFVPTLNNVKVIKEFVPQSNIVSTQAGNPIPLSKQIGGKPIVEFVPQASKTAATISPVSQTTLSNKFTEFVPQATQVSKIKTFTPANQSSEIKTFTEFIPQAKASGSFPPPASSTMKPVSSDTPKFTVSAAEFVPNGLGNSIGEQKPIGRPQAQYSTYPSVEISEQPSTNYHSNSSYEYAMDHSIDLFLPNKSSFAAPARKALATFGLTEPLRAHFQQLDLEALQQMSPDDERHNEVSSQVWIIIPS